MDLQNTRVKIKKKLTSENKKGHCTKQINFDNVFVL